MPAKKIRGYFAFLLVLFASMTLCAWIISFGLWSSYSRYEARLSKHRAALHFQKKADVPLPKLLDDSFWEKFDIVSHEHFGSWGRGVNRFAAQVYYPLPALMASSEALKFRWEVMPLKAEGIGQAIALEIHSNLLPCPAPEGKKLLIWFDNGQSVPASIEQCSKDWNFFATDPTQSIPLSGTLNVGSVPVLISQGRQAVRLSVSSQDHSKEMLAWYRKICNPKTDKGLLDNIQGWYIQATALNQESLENIEWGKEPVKVTNFLPFA